MSINDGLGTAIYRHPGQVDFLISIFAVITYPWLEIMQVRFRFSRHKSVMVLGALIGLSITFVQHILSQGWGLNLGNLMQFPAVGALGGYIVGVLLSALVCDREPGGEGADA